MPDADSAPVAMVGNEQWKFRLEGETWVPYERVVQPEAPWRGPVCVKCGGRALGPFAIVCQSPDCGHIENKREWDNIRRMAGLPPKP